MEEYTRDYFKAQYPQFVIEMALNAIINWGLSARIPPTDMIGETFADLGNKFIQDLANADYKTRRAVIKKWL